jgi:hypothetical protein
MKTELRTVCQMNIVIVFISSFNDLVCVPNITPSNVKLNIYFLSHLVYIICRICDKCVCSRSAGSWMSAQWRNSSTFFVHLDIIWILVLGFYSGLSRRVRTVYLFSLCVVSLLSSRFTASAWAWFSNFLKYLVFHFFISLSTMFVCRSWWILWLFIHKLNIGMEFLGYYLFT